MGWSVTSEGPSGTLRPRSEHCCTSILQSNIYTVSALSLILFRFLARYRPGLRDWGTVNGTQTGISGTIIYILIQNLRKNDISSSLSCNPATGRLNSALSPTW